MLKKILKILTPIALSYWIGSMLFFSFVFAPRVFKVLERDDAARLQNAIFYPYYFSLSMAAVVALIACVVFAKLMRFAIGLNFISLMSFLAGYFYLTPTLTQMYENNAPQEQFDNIHNASVYLSLFALCSGLFLLFTYLKTLKTTAV